MVRSNPLGEIFNSIGEGVKLAFVIFFLLVILGAFALVPGITPQGKEVLNQTQQGISNFATLYFGMPPWEMILLFLEIISIISIGVGFFVKRSRDRKNSEWNRNFG